jgi:hypothetical protein
MQQQVIESFLSPPGITQLQADGNAVALFLNVTEEVARALARRQLAADGATIVNQEYNANIMYNATMHYGVVHTYLTQWCSADSETFVVRPGQSASVVAAQLPNGKGHLCKLPESTLRLPGVCTGASVRANSADLLSYKQNFGFICTFVDVVVPYTWQWESGAPAGSVTTLSSVVQAAFSDAIDAMNSRDIVVTLVFVMNQTQKSMSNVACVWIDPDATTDAR